MDDRLSGLRQAVYETAIPFQRARAAHAEAISSEQISEEAKQIASEMMKSDVCRIEFGNLIWPHFSALIWHCESIS
jgi:hypothetical protein